jgi:hypothetical protein
MNGHISSRTFQRGSLEDATKSLKTALSINPRFTEAYVLEGQV